MLLTVSCFSLEFYASQITSPSTVQSLLTNDLLPISLFTRAPRLSCLLRLPVWKADVAVFVWGWHKSFCSAKSMKDGSANVGFSWANLMRARFVIEAVQQKSSPGNSLWELSQWAVKDKGPVMSLDLPVWSSGNVASECIAVVSRGPKNVCIQGLKRWSRSSQYEACGCRQ